MFVVFLLPCYLVSLRSEHGPLHPISNTLTLCFSRHMKTKVHNHTKQQAKLYYCVSSYFWLTNWKTKDSSVVFQEINKRTANNNCIRTIKVLTEYKMSKYNHY